MKYKSVHAYLDEVFKDRWAVSEDQIIAAKKNYWRMYNTDLKARQRSGRKEFSVWFTSQEFTQLQKYIEDLPVSDFIRQAVFVYTGVPTANPSITVDPRVEQQLVLISGLVEEALIDGIFSDSAAQEIRTLFLEIVRLLRGNDC